ncbi:TrmH family RNA methyltransferase [Spongisporangium articulatum]|uniref:TrmH family RNA methyltransferase n=1 Tax=Spongisporangium articulatum TaxID=3362603 RepID=A0ABW8AUR6_9ACTN
MLSGETLANPRSDRVKAVARLSGRPARLRAGRFLVEGPQSVREALRFRAADVVQLYVTEAAAQRYAEIVAAALAADVPVTPVTEAVLAAMAGDDATVNPQGLLAVCGLVDVPLDEVLAARPRLVAVLAQVRDPGNAGTVIRAADAAGADAVLLTDASVDVHNPKCVRSTAGSLFHLPVVTGVPLPDAVAALKAADLAVLAADGAGRTDLDDLLDEAETARTTGAPALLRGPVAWVFGNEAWGLPPADRALADQVVRVPVHGHAESLNLGTAATVCLYASARAHR